jgi:hypothetical protein
VPLANIQSGATTAVATFNASWVASPGTLVVDVLAPNNSAALVGFTLNVVAPPALTITNAPLFGLYAGQSRSVNLQVVGGTPGPTGFRWALGAGTPSWVSLQPTGARTATLGVAPPGNTAAVTIATQVIATDGLTSPAAVSSPPLPAQFAVEAVPDLLLQGLPSNNKLQPDQQYTIQFGTSRNTSLHLTGNISLGSPASEFVVGTSEATTVPFDIAANCSLGASCSPTYTLKAGTVSGPVAITGTVAATATQTAAGTPPTVPFPAVSLQQDPAPPAIDVNRISVRSTASGFDVCVPGFTNTRQMNDVSFRFVAAGGKTISPPQNPRPVDSDFGGWFAQPAAANQGGFTLVQTFNVTGDIAAVGQLFVTLRNSAGPSQEAGPIDLATAPRCTIP